MTGNIAARRYARALFAIGQKQGLAELDAFGSELSAVAKAVEESPALARLFRNPLFSIEEKRAVLAKLLQAAGAGQTVSNFCNLLADKGRLADLPDINAFYSLLLDAEKGIIRGELVTAIKLAKAKRDAVKEQLEKQAGQKIELNFSVDKDILGGVVLKVGDRVLDASLRAQLGILKDNIKRGE
ncbi:ATP synthase subunit delta [Oleidesulfovibrio alaskensis G20]|uniref:ATP synthase subunit delta n=1 Tax=Oleidesulfovibrio alaskensis (strain ATCC BAA-1058 / DSM 17464 / G20) TaxID=207559 RepID=ATPD_OLEA2|nr:ATP synthase F1 subunit delta [Oleidesulfovibrio alaskensis]Q313V7.1 RecName: Full=ATP synthase subunit delta; AltName: Full=ATP synthase F(1) sector subunit delta; AltName: Full=F-type ATPase subunit delta; Short=F-ATPase subunit delta [Oleidesulfovibrio alaskensis G20]ABB37789.1 ATP synthase subunit delta [Oleidesulfovibrio alaskensis G20]MBG0773745.1 F0F1 ATP synthase subunit delta [Oleidesulfovibrio alaskensis]MBL3582403.1 F0F1 ATP synthase subunit delta [Oleidesulfovibrio alaskensis]